MTETYRQGNPYCVQIELVEGCNLRCDFCGLNSIRGKDNDFKRMSTDTAQRIAKGMPRPVGTRAWSLPCTASPP